MQIHICDKCRTEVVDALPKLTSDIGLDYEVIFKQKRFDTKWGEMSYTLCKACLIKELKE